MPMIPRQALEKLLQELQQEVLSLREQKENLELAMLMNEIDLRVDQLVEMSEQLPPHQRPTILSASLH